MLEINKRFTPYNFTAMANKKNLYIVIHYVGSESTAKNNVTYFATGNRGASAHYFVDETSIWQCVDDKDKSWHCGGGLQGSGGHKFYGKCTNSNSIGIEMCCKKNAKGEWYFEPDTVNNTVDLVAYLMKKHGIPIERVIRHYDVTGKLCPEPYVDESAWEKFKNQIERDKPMTDKERKELKDLANKVDMLLNPMIYSWVDDNMPEWARPTVTKLVDRGFLKGDEEGKLNLTDDMLRILVVLDRAGAFDV